MKDEFMDGEDPVLAQHLSTEPVSGHVQIFEQIILKLSADLKIEE